MDELSLKKNKNKESLLNAEDEVEISDGLTNKSALFITVIEARDLVLENLNLIGDSKIFVTLQFQGGEQSTNSVRGSPTPQWYENFKFKVTEPSGALKLEVFENNLMGQKSLGSLALDMTDLMDQKKRLQWYELYNSTNNNCGHIRLKLNCIINFKHFYQSEIEDAENKMKIIQSAINITDYFVNKMNEPFGLLFADNLEYLINNQELKKADDLINYMQAEAKKDSIYKPDNSYRPSGKLRISLNKLNIALLYCLFFISLFSLLERSDYINLIVSIIVIYCFIFDKDSNIIKSLRQYLLLLGGAVVFDFIWFITNFGSFFIGEQGDPESGIKRLIYFFGICSTVIKCLLVLALLHLRRKKLPIESKIEEE